MLLLEVSGLPDLASAAAAVFHRDYLPKAQQMLGEGVACLIIAFDEADYTHAGWRLAAVQALARENAPARVNAISGGTAAARAAAIDYLTAGAGITGQYLPLDDAGAGVVVSSAA